MTIRIRPATPSDAPAIARVHVDSWRTSYDGIVPQEILSGLSYGDRQALWDDILASSRPDRCCFVAETERAQVVGFVCGGLGTASSEAYKGEIYSIYLLQDFQRLGLGRRLFLAACESLLQAGVDSMLLWVFEENHASRQFYEALGGKLVDRKELNIDGVNLIEVAYGWKNIASLCCNGDRSAAPDSA